MKCPIMMKVAASGASIVKPIKRFGQLLSGKRVKTIKNLYSYGARPGAASIPGQKSYMAMLGKMMDKEKGLVKNTRLATGAGVGIGSVGTIMMNGNIRNNKVAGLSEYKEHREYDNKVRRGGTAGAWAGSSLGMLAGLGVSTLAMKKNPLHIFKAPAILGASSLTGGIVGHSIGRKKALGNLK